LYHAYEIILPVSPGAEAITGQLNYNVMVDSFGPEDIRLQRERSLQGLEAEKKLLAAAAGDDIVIECATDEIRLADSINDIAEKYHAGLVVLGISEKEGLERILFGGSAIGVVDGSKYPVLVVPLKAAIEPVGRIVFAYDLEKVDQTFPGTELKKLLDAFGATLKVVHVDKDHSGWAAEAEGPGGMPGLRQLLEPYHPSFDFIENEDIVEGILHYAGENQASLILTIGKSHGFFKSLFHRSVTHKLAYQAPTPLLVVH
jgi:nucleotide-binding universal stress UspA family protein